MSRSQVLTPATAAVDIAETFGYPATAEVCVLNGESPKHLIWYTAAPAALFDNAPVGSVCFDYTNGDAYICTAAATWTKASP